MAANRDDFMGAVDRLEQALATVNTEKGSCRTAEVDKALAEVEASARQHAEALLPADGSLIKVDRPLLPSPGVDRRAEALKQELEGLGAEAATLRQRVGNVELPPNQGQDPTTLAGALPVAPELGAVPDFSVFCARARQLLHSLQHYEEEEVELILKSVNTDIGAGD